MTPACDGCLGTGLPLLSVRCCPSTPLLLLCPACRVSITEGCPS